MRNKGMYLLQSFTYSEKLKIIQESEEIRYCTTDKYSESEMEEKFCKYARCSSLGMQYQPKCSSQTRQNKTEVREHYNEGFKASWGWMVRFIHKNNL
jgi:hypothetical protein